MIKKCTLQHSVSQSVKLKAIIAVFLLAFSFARAQNQLVLIPYTGSTSIPCGQNSLVQAHNGSTGTYSNNANGFVVINAGFASVITINATYTTEASFDYIRIYNGVGTGGTLLGSYSGQNGTFTYAGTAGQTLTVQFTSDGSVTYAGFNLLVSYNGPCFATPCAGVPPSNNVVGSPLNICPAMNTTLALATQYQLNGLQYQWYQSTVSNVGPFTTVAPSATMTSLVTSPLSTTTWFTAVVTCTNSNMSYTTASQEVQVMGTTTNAVPYGEGFESVQIDDMLPNCSWSAANLGSTVKTSIIPQSNNRVPNNGTKFGYFSLPSTNNAMYSNGIYMEPGITYSAGLFYATEYFGYANWNNLSLAVGASQAAAGQVTVASTAPALSGSYKELGGLFTVPTAGFYYLQIAATASSGNAMYLMIDDISVTIPCTPISGNSPTVSATAATTLICAGDAIPLTATGADTYLWSTGATSASTSDSPVMSTTYTAIGTNTLTGCTDTEIVTVSVNPTPSVSAVSSAPQICPGQTSYLTGLGANSYVWNTNQNGNVIAVSPNATTSYTVIGTNQYGCTNSAAVSVGVMPIPNITAVNVLSPNSCIGDAATFNGNGGVSYQWNLSTTPVLYSGASITVVLYSPTTITVTGTGTNGCSNKYTLTQNVEICTGLTELGIDKSVKVFPNPTNSRITIVAGGSDLQAITICDLSGRVLQSTTIAESSAEVDLSNLSTGLYLAKVQTAAGVATIRLVKE